MYRLTPLILWAPQHYREISLARLIEFNHFDWIQSGWLSNRYYFCLIGGHNRFVLQMIHVCGLNQGVPAFHLCVLWICNFASFMFISCSRATMCAQCDTPSSIACKHWTVFWRCAKWWHLHWRGPTLPPWFSRRHQNLQNHLRPLLRLLWWEVAMLPTERDTHSSPAGLQESGVP